MAKTLLAAAMMVLCGATIAPMGSASITISPSPPTQGQKVKLTCEGIPPGTVLNLDWNPGPATTATVGADGIVVVTVPANAEDVIVTDPKSGAEAATTVTPS